MLKKLFGNKSFYKSVFKVTLPIMIQQLLINVVSLVDNLMVGQLDENVISGVYIASKILFVINMALFGAIEGASVFFAQFFGSKDEKHLKQCFNFKLYADTFVSIIGMVILLFFSRPIAELFVNSEQALIASNYLKIYAICLIPFILTNVFGTCYREVNKSFVPMIGSLLALFINITLNYVFIFALGLGYKGAAIATVIARFSECSFIIVYSIITKPMFVQNVFKHFKIDLPLAKNVFIKSLPLFLNEICWATGQIMLIFAYSKVSETAAPALSISQTLFDVFYLANIALGNGIAVIMGNTLGANNLKEAKKQITYFMTLAIMLAILMGGLLAIIGPQLSKIYNVSEASRHLAIMLIVYNVVLMPIFSTNCAMFFMIRSGGFTAIVLIFDSVFSWLIQVPLALILAYKSSLTLPTQFLIVNLAELIKLGVGIILLKSGIWIRNLTNDEKLLKTA